MADYIDLNPPVDPANHESIDLTPQTSSPAVSLDYAQTKASRYALAMGDASPGGPAILAQIMSGQAGQLNNQLATLSNSAKVQQNQQILARMAATRNPFHPPSEEEKTTLAGIAASDGQNQNPDTALSASLSNKYIDLMGNIPGNQQFLPAAMENQPQAYDLADTAQWQAQRTLEAQDAYQEIDQARSDESLGTSALNVLKTFIPGYSTVITRNAVTNSQATALLPGNNWTEQISYLYSLPPDQFRTQLRSAISDIQQHNPGLAQDFAQAALSYSASDASQQNVGAIADFATMAPIGKLTKGAEMLVGGATKALGERVAVGAEQKVAEAAVANAGNDSRLLNATSGNQGGVVIPEVPTAEQLANTGNGTGIPANVNSPAGTTPVIGTQTDEAAAAQRIASQSNTPNLEPAANNNLPVSSGLPVPQNPERASILEAASRTSPRPEGTYPTGVQTHSDMSGLEAANTNLAAGLDKVASAVVHDPQDIPAIAADVGLNELAAKTTLTQNLAADDPTGLVTLGSKTPPQIEAMLPESMSPGNAFAQKSSLASTAVARSSNAILKSQALGKAASSDFIQRILRVDRLNPEQLQVGANEAFDKLKDIFAGSNHAFVGQIVHKAEEDPLTNLYRVSMQIGQRDGTMFPSRKAAEDFVRTYIAPKTNDFLIKTDGIGGWYSEVTRNIDETQAIRDVEISTPYRTPMGWVNQTMGWARGADYQLPKGQTEARGIVVHSSEFGASLIRDTNKELDALGSGKGGKAAKEGIEKVLRSNNSNRIWQRTRQDFETEYLAVNGHLPTAAQADAYGKIVDLHDLDYGVRTLDVTMQKGRQGAERFSFPSFEKKDGNIVGTNSEFDGKEYDSLPWQSKDPFMVQVVDGAVPGKEYYSKLMNDSSRAEINQAIQNGSKIILNPNEGKYYIVKSFTRDRVPLDTLGFVEGGHDIYRFENYLKQGKLSPIPQGVNQNPVRRYSGDISYASLPTHEHAQQVAKLMNQGREMVLRNDPGTAAWWGQHLDHFVSLNDFKKQVAMGSAQLDVPFIATKAGQTTLDVQDWSRGIENFFDATQNEHNIFSNITGRFLGEKAAVKLPVLQAEGDRVVKTIHDALLNPWDAMRSATQDMLDTRIVSDYKQKVAADWIQEYGSIFKDNIEKVRANPLEYLNHPSYAPGADPIRIRAAENVRLRTLELNNYQTLWDRQVQAYKSKLLDATFDKFGPDARDFLDQRVLPKIQNADKYLRAMAFQTKMGMFNPKQFFVQASELAKIALISPVHSVQAARQLMFNRMALQTENPQVLSGLANRFAGLMGVDKDDWLKQIDAFKRSGFSIVSHDQGYLDTVSAVSKPGILGKILDLGTTPFREGELVARNLGYSTAWGEWKAANPGAVLDRYAEASILQRAKDLTNNMGRDSNAVWQRGLPSIVTQFMGYQARLMDQLWDGGLLSNGRKLSRGEKLRVLTGMSALYGIPVGATAAVGVVPIRDAIKDWMAQEGMLSDKDDDTPNVFLDGLIPYALHASLGENYDVAQSYGPYGFPAFYELFNGDKSWSDVLQGASGAVLGDTVKNTLGATANTISDIQDLSNNTGSFSLLASDLLKPFQEIGTVDAARRLIQIVNTRNWIAKSGALLKDDATVQDGIMTAMFGINPESISDAYDKLSNSGKVFEAQSTAQKDVRQFIANGQRLGNNGDMDGARVWFKRARAAAVQGGLTPKQYLQASNQGWSDVPLTDKADQTYQKFQQNNLQYRYGGD